MMAAIHLAKANLSTFKIEIAGSTKIGIEITYGIRQSKELADADMKAQKAERETSGKRTPRDSKAPPRGFSKTTGMEAPVNAEAGSNYVAMIGILGLIAVYVLQISGPLGGG